MVAGEPHAAVPGDEHLPESGDSERVVAYVVEVGIFRVVGKHALVVHEHPDLSVAVEGDECHLVADGLPAVGGAGEGLKAVEDIVVAAHAVVGADPDVPVAVLGEAVDVVGGEAEIGGREDVEAPSVIAVQPVVGSNPDEAPRVLHDAAHPVVGQAAARGGQVGELILSCPPLSRFRQGEEQQQHCHENFHEGFYLHLLLSVISIL